MPRWTRYVRTGKSAMFWRMQRALDTVAFFNAQDVRFRTANTVVRGGVRDPGHWLG